MLLIHRKLPTGVLAGQAAGTALHLALGLTAFAHSLPAPSPSTFSSHSVSALAGQGGPPDGGHSDSKTLVTMYISQAVGVGHLLTK